VTRRPSPCHFNGEVSSFVVSWPSRFDLWGNFLCQGGEEGCSSSCHFFFDAARWYGVRTSDDITCHRGICSNGSGQLRNTTIVESRFVEFRNRSEPMINTMTVACYYGNVAIRPSDAAFVGEFLFFVRSDAFNASRFRLCQLKLLNCRICWLLLSRLNGSAAVLCPFVFVN